MRFRLYFRLGPDRATAPAIALDRGGRLLPTGHSAEQVPHVGEIGE